MCISNKYKACISVSEVKKSPYWMYTLNGEGRMIPFIQSPYLQKRRQELPKIFAPNGAIYLAETKNFIKNKGFVSKDTYAYEMPKNRSLDIDNEEDFVVLEEILRRNFN